MKLRLKKIAIGLVFAGAMHLTVDSAGCARARADSTHGGNEPAAVATGGVGGGGAGGSGALGGSGAAGFAH